MSEPYTPFRNYILEFDLYCIDPASSPIYRIFIDGDLIVERTYIWNNIHEYLREEIYVNLDFGYHKLSIESLGTRRVFFTANATLNGRDIVIENGQFLC
jgi:hypothetical protein